MLQLLYVRAGLSEVAGIGFLIWELLDARRRLRTFVADASHKELFGSDSVAMADVASTGLVAGPRTLEQRVDALEEGLDHHRREHPGIERRLREHATSEAEQKANDVRNNLAPEITKLLSHMLSEGHRPRYRPWWLSPALLSLGVVVGTGANLIAVASL